MPVTVPRSESATYPALPALRVQVERQRRQRLIASDVCAATRPQRGAGGGEEAAVQELAAGKHDA